MNRGPLSETLAQDERRGCSRDHEKLDLLLVVPDGHGHGSGTEWGRVGDGVRLPSDRNKWLIGVSEMWS